MTGSEDLGQSLRAEMESYLDRRLSALQEELARLHGEINEAFTRLAERLESERHDPSFGHAFSEQLRDVVGASSSGSGDAGGGATSTTDMALIKAAVEDIQGQGTQADVLNTLVNRASSFAPRVAFFVVKNNRATGWRARGLEGTVGDDSIREISLPLSEQNLLSEAVNSRATWSGAPGTNVGDHELLSSFSDEPPARIVAIPLVARDKAVAVLYADSAELDGEAINLEALETLVRVSGMAVELRAGGRLAAAPASTAAEPVAAAAQSAPVEAPVASAPAPAVVKETVAPAPAEKPAATPVSVTPVSVMPAPAPAVAAAPAVEEEKYEQVSATTEQPRSPAPAPPPPPMPSVPPPLPQPSPAVPAMPAAADPLAQTQAMPTASAPLGTKRRWGQAEAELPVEVSEDERRFHNDARRFARLLVSEIKLYNEQKVKDGRVEGNLYERLREEIDRSRQMYDKRVAANVAERYDYFHNELVGTLAEGDATKLGADYPATASSSG